MKILRYLAAAAFVILSGPAFPQSSHTTDGLVIGSTHDQVGSTTPVANVTALRALTTAFIGNYVDLASYYAAAGAAPDGGGGLMAYDSTDTTTADNGATVFVDAASRRWKRVLNGQLLTVLQIGCVNDFISGTHDCTSQLNVAMGLGAPVMIPANTTVNATTGNVTVGASSGFTGPGGGSFASSTLNMNGNFLQLSGISGVVDGITLTGTNVNALLYCTGTNLQRNRVTNNLIFNFTGVVIQINCQLNQLLFANNIILAGNSYGLLYNDSGSAGNDLIISGNFISVSGVGEPIEINSPTGTGLRDIVISGNDLTGNFGVGLANGHNYTITGNYINATTNGLHLEDGQYGGVVTGNTITMSGSAGDGIFVEKNPSSALQGEPVTIVGNTIRHTGGATATSATQSGTVLTIGGTITGTFAAGQYVGGAGFNPDGFISSLGTGTGGAGTYNMNVSQTVASPVAVVAGAHGIHNVSNGFGTIPDSNYSNNTIIGFPVCAYLNGATTYGFENNLLSGCPAGIVSDNPMTAVGKTRLHNVQLGAFVAGGSQVGKLIWDDVSAISIVKKNGTAVPGVTLEGFAVVGIPLTIAGSGAQTATISPVCGLMNGRLRSILGIAGGTANGVMRESSVTYNGTTFAETAGTIIDNDVGALTGAAPTVSGGNLIENFSSSGALSSYLANVDFSGTCYQP